MSEEMFGPYRLVSRLGRGGMGEVWRAIDTAQDDRVVALKVLRAWLDGDEDFDRRFRRESALAARLSGPHIVPIHRYGDIDGRLFLDMALVEGPDLRALIAREGPLPAPRAVGIIAQVAKALSVAHRSGLVHRDVKPSNILVSTDDGDDHAYLIDFGISRAMDATSISISGAFVGTAAYMAPERFAGAGDHRGDVYALGCVLYEALTGRPPFPATDLVTAMNAHLTAPPPRPSTLQAESPVGLDAVVARALARAPEQRFGTAAELAAAAQRALAEPVTTGPPPPDRAPTPPPRGSTLPIAPSGTRRRAPLLAVAVAALLVACIGVLTVWGPGAGDPISVAEILTGHTDIVRSVATSQLDGRPVVVSGSVDTTVRVWDVDTATPIGAPFTGHTDIVYAVATGQLDGRTVAVSGGEDDTVQVWDLATHAPIGVPLVGHTSGVLAVATGELDGRPVVVSGGYDATVRVWDLATGAPVGVPAIGHTQRVRAVTTAQLDGRPVVVSGSYDGTVRVWDMATGAAVGLPFTGHTGFVYALTVVELDGRTVVVSASADATVRRWDLATGAPVGAPLTGHTGVVRGVATMQLDGRTVIVSGGEDNTLRVWDATTGTPVGAPLTGHTGAVYAVAVTRVDGHPIVVSGSDDRTVRLWDLTTRTGP